MNPNNFAEKVIWYSIIGTYVFYFTGLLYFVGPIVGWFLTVYLSKKLWKQTKKTPIAQRITIPWTVGVWVVCMLLMEVALVIGHADFDLGMAAVLKSSFGWTKGWALWAVFPLIGCLHIRPQLIYRAICILGLQSLILCPVFYAGFILRLPSPLYTVPLDFFGGPSGAFSVSPYVIDPETNLVRIGLFAPWASAIGMVGAVYFPLCIRESNNRWRWIGMTGCLLMCWISGSRLAVLSIFIAWILSEVLASLHRPSLLFVASGLSVVSGLFIQKILSSIEIFNESFRNIRKSSNSVRETLDSIAIQRWPEAPITGHGTVETGPHIVQFMFIGSHNTWIGLLFVKGIVGFIALAIPMMCSFIDLLVKAQKSPVAKIALRILIVIFLNTFADSIEVTAYLIWPALVFLGIASKQQQSKLSYSYAIS